MSLPQYFSIGLALVIFGRAIHYLAITRYLNQHGIETARGRFSIHDWTEWAAYRKARLSDHEPLTWWYALWAIQIILFFWVVGWVAFSLGAVKIGMPSHLVERTGNPGQYITVFDVTQSGFRQWWFSAFGLILLAAGLALPTLIRIGIFRKPPPWMEKWFPKIVVGFAIFWTLTSFIATFGDYQRATRAMYDNRAEVVEGIVTQFKPMPYTGHVNESFVVQGVRFEYSDYGITAGFNNTASHGGPIREGLAVKIWHLGGEILRLDIKKEPNQAPQPTTGWRDLPGGKRRND